MNIRLPTAPGQSAAAHRGVALVVEDHPLFAQAVSDLVSWARPSLAVQRCLSVADARSFLSHALPALVVLDLTLPDSAGESTVEAVVRHCPGVPVIVVSAEDTPAMVNAALKAGAARFISKAAKPQEIARVIRDVLCARGFADSTTDAAAEGCSASLSPRQREVLEEMATGKSNKEIAISLAMSPETVKAHVQAIFSRIGVRNRTEAVRRFLTSSAPPAFQMDH